MDGWLLITQNNVLMKPIQITGKIQHTMLHKIFFGSIPTKHIYNQGTHKKS